MDKDGIAKFVSLKRKSTEEENHQRYDQKIATLELCAMLEKVRCGLMCGNFVTNGQPSVVLEKLGCREVNV